MGVNIRIPATEPLIHINNMDVTLAGDFGSHSEGSVVLEAVALYPEPYRADQNADVPRLEFQLQLVESVARIGGRIMDVGGGVGAFSPSLALGGFQVTLVDDFADPVNSDLSIHGLGIHARLGIEVISVDASSDAFAPELETFDIITCIDTIEHWHRSPKASLHKMIRALRPGGTLVLGVPNAVNLRKRIMVPLGHNNWSPFECWYEEPVFRSHVREADVGTLRRIAGDLGLGNVRIFGRNWAATCSPKKLKRTIARNIDPLLRLRPSLCSDLYLVGTRPV